MLIRNSISSTKRFFQKTVGNLKSFFTASHYQKLPKSSPNYNSFSFFAQDMSNNTQQNYKDLDNLYLDFTDQLDSTSKKEKKKIISSTPSNTDGQRGQQVSQSSRSFNKPAQLSSNNEKQRKEANNSNNKRMVENRGLVAKKLKELAMMDMNNLDHVLDLEEVLHYYSRLTSPVYLEIVDNFFMELYTEFFGSTTTTSACYNGNNVKVDPRVVRTRSITMRSSN